MFEYQRKYLRAITTKDERTVYYFPRAMGKTYVRNLIKKIGEIAPPPKESQEKEPKLVLDPEWKQENDENFWSK